MNYKKFKNNATKVIGIMDYQIIADKFIQQYPDYKSDINNFSEYLNAYWKNSLSNDLFRILVRGMDIEFVLQSLVYNVEEIKRYKTKSKARRYSVVIGQFLKYIFENTNITNSELYDMIAGDRSQKSYMKCMTSYINKCDILKGVVQSEPLSSTQAKDLLEWCNKQFVGNEWDDTGFKKAMAAIAYKFMMLYGITYRELRKMKWEDYDEYYGFISINNFDLRLPSELSLQMKRIKKFVLDKQIGDDDGLIFVSFSGEGWGKTTSSSGLADYLKTEIGDASVSSVIKYGILQLIKVGVNSSEISKLTGAQNNFIESCIDPSDKDIFLLVNRAVVNSDIYNFC